MAGSEIRKRVVLSPIALAVAIGVAAQTLLPLPWSPIESAQASHQQCSPAGGGGGRLDRGCCGSPGSGGGGGGGGGGGQADRPAAGTNGAPQSRHPPPGRGR